MLSSGFQTVLGNQRIPGDNWKKTGKQSFPIPPGKNSPCSQELMEVRRQQFCLFFVGERKRKISWLYTILLLIPVPAVEKAHSWARMTIDYWILCKMLTWHVNLACRLSDGYIFTIKWTIWPAGVKDRMNTLVSSSESLTWTISIIFWMVPSTLIQRHFKFLHNFLPLFRDNKMQLGAQVNCKFQAKMVWREKYLAKLTENYKLEKCWHLAFKKTTIRFGALVFFLRLLLICY